MAPSAEAGIQLLTETPIALALVDVMLPRMSGLEFLQRAQQLSPGIEVIMMTGSMSVKTTVDAMRLGAYVYVRKPFASLDKLAAVVNRASRARTAQRRA